VKVLEDSSGDVLVTVPKEKGAAHLAAP